jgi:hypothetical protein
MKGFAGIYILCFIMFLSCIVKGGNTGLTEEDRVIIEAAKEQLNEWLEKIPVNSERLYGFNDRSGFRKAAPGNVYRVCRQAGDDAKGEIVYSGEVRVPVIAENEYKIFVTLVKIEGKWTIVDLSGAPLAKNLQKVEESLKGKVFMERLFIRDFKADKVYAGYRDGKEIKTYLLNEEHKRKCANVQM